MGAKTKRFKKRLLQIFSFVVLIGIVAAGFNIYAAIQKANLLKVSVEESSYRSGINQQAIKAADYQFVLVTFSVKNNGSDPVSFDPLKHTYVSDSSGARYAASDLQVKRLFKPVSIGKDETRSGQLSYAVPNGASKLKFHLTLINPEVNFTTALNPSS